MFEITQIHMIGLYDFFFCHWSSGIRGPLIILVIRTLAHFSTISENLRPLSRSAEKLEGEKLNVAEVTQSEIAQKQKLQTVLERINDSLKLSARSIRWNVDCEGHFWSFFSHLLSLLTFPASPNFASATQSERPSLAQTRARLFSRPCVFCGQTADISASPKIYTKQPGRSCCSAGQGGNECCLFIRVHFFLKLCS